MFLNIFQEGFTFIALRLRGSSENLFLAKLNASSPIFLVILNIQTTLQKILGNK